MTAKFWSKGTLVASQPDGLCEGAPPLSIPKMKAGRPFDLPLAEALDNPARRTSEGLPLAAEVRAHAKGLPESKLWLFVAEAVEAGDLPTVAAILAAQPFLSGLSAKQAANARELAARKFAPVHYDQLVATEKVIDRVKAASQSFLGRFGKVIDLRNSPKAKADNELAKLKQSGT